MNYQEVYARWQIQARELPTPALAACIKTACQALEFGQVPLPIALGQLEVMIIEQARRSRRAPETPAP